MSCPDNGDLLQMVNSMMVVIVFSTTYHNTETVYAADACKLNMKLGSVQIYRNNKNISQTINTEYVACNLYHGRWRNMSLSEVSTVKWTQCKRKYT